MGPQLFYGLEHLTDPVSLRFPIVVSDVAAGATSPRVLYVRCEVPREQRVSKTMVTDLFSLCKTRIRGGLRDLPRRWSMHLTTPIHLDADVMSYICRGFYVKVRISGDDITQSDTAGHAMVNTDYLNELDGHGSYRGNELKQRNPALATTPATAGSSDRPCSMVRLRAE